MKKTLLLISALGLAGCGASTSHKVAAVKVGDELYKPDSAAAMAIDTKSGDKIVCERRIVTGSHRKEKTCTTKRQKELERQRAQEVSGKASHILNRQLAIDKNSDGG